MDNVLSHIDENGKAKMVDVSDKTETNRIAIACGKIKMKESTLNLIIQGDIEKGDVLGTARIAGIMGSKRTSDLIPMCHPLMINNCKVSFNVDEKNNAILIEASAKTTGKTGVEMEALTAVSIAALTIYDMCKAVDKGMIIEDIHLLKKSGGKSGEWSFDNNL
jgi:cyclic pyranopterin monophosphate synthase